MIYNSQIITSKITVSDHTFKVGDILNYENNVYSLANYNNLKYGNYIVISIIDNNNFIISNKGLYNLDLTNSLGEIFDVLLLEDKTYYLSNNGITFDTNNINVLNKLFKVVSVSGYKVKLEIDIDINIMYNNLYNTNNIINTLTSSIIGDII